MIDFLRIQNDFIIFNWMKRNEFTVSIGCEGSESAIFALLDKPLMPFQGIIKKKKPENLMREILRSETVKTKENVTAIPAL